MQCKQCGKWFVEHDIYEQFCSVECFTKAQRDSLHYSSPRDLKLYHDGEEVKRIENFNPEKYYAVKCYD